MSRYPSVSFSLRFSLSRFGTHGRTMGADKLLEYYSKNKQLSISILGSRTDQRIIFDRFSTPQPEPKGGQRGKIKRVSANLPIKASTLYKNVDESKAKAIYSECFTRA